MTTPSSAFSRLKVSRRTALLTSAAGALGLALAPGTAQQFPRSHATNAATYRMRLGRATLHVISDGQSTFAAHPTFARDQNAEAVAAAMRAHFMNPPDYRVNFNGLAFVNGDAITVIDPGSGPSLGPSLGRFAGRFDQLRFARSAVTCVLITHAHLDHIGALVSEDGVPLFPNAEHLISDGEVRQWLGEDIQFGAMQISDDFKAGFRAAIDKNLKLLGQQLAPFPGDRERDLSSGISAIPAPGHSLGHTAYRLSSGEASVVVVGDLFHNQAFDLDHPDWTLVFDAEPDRAAATRRRLLDQFATDRDLVFAYHMPFPGLGHIVRTGATYRWVPTPWLIDEDPQ